MEDLILTKLRRSKSERVGLKVNTDCFICDVNEFACTLLMNAQHQRMGNNEGQQNRRAVSIDFFNKIRLMNLLDH